MKSLIGKQVVVRLKWNKTEYKGQLMSTDNYLNLQLDDTYEIIYDKDDNKREELIGSIFIRCNNVLFIREFINSDGSKVIPKGPRATTETTATESTSVDTDGNVEKKTEVVEEVEMKE
ncbi:uncharacterized protein KGF55_002193 [Candida pseudojiufengensis]|uniref:uncharacterized protein n=1 Tax=Candida pseudojiufengensis TaxID=497109 RepID=UPI0022244BC7|nr:uncharacterized protein KGF55_002193 [Candida pseudojiufengensis]KAI5964251.1 hypothetical protein KGF55_002193 [Candida pseudojiufengensis]